MSSLFLTSKAMFRSAVHGAHHTVIVDPQQFHEDGQAFFSGQQLGGVPTTAMSGGQGVRSCVNPPAKTAPVGVHTVIRVRPKKAELSRPPCRIG